nr:hypothetical protein GCM10025730_23050 [Promicromonospora thailandica]
MLLRIRMTVMHGQTRQYRLPATPPGEVVARSMDADRFVRYADRWVDFVNGLLIVVATAVISGTWTAGAVLLAVMVISAGASAIGRPIAGRSAAGSSAARARFGRALVSALDSARTVKLAARTPDVRRHLGEVDSGRVKAAIFEHRVQAVLDAVPHVTLYVGVVAAWAFLLTGRWDLATTLLVANAVTGFAWFGVVAGAVVTEAPGTRAWQVATARFADGADLVSRQHQVDLVAGTAPAPEPAPREPLDRLQLRDLTAVHDDGTIGVSGVDLEIRRGELVLLLGQVGSGKSSLLSALAGLMEHTGEVRWNGTEVTDAQAFLRPGQVAHVAQVPRVLSGSFSDNVQLDHARDIDGPVRGARLEQDMRDAGGPHALVGHRGVRLSGGQVQRLALARALAADTELLLADDVSSALDASTEIELWAALRERGTTVVGATSKRAALARADRVVVLVDGAVADVGPWAGLAPGGATWRADALTGSGPRAPIRSVQVPQPRPHRVPPADGVAAHEHGHALLLVVDAHAVVEPCPLGARIKPGAPRAGRLREHERHGRRPRRGTVLPELVVPRVRRRQPQLRPEPVDGTRLAVVLREHHGPLPVGRRQRRVHRGDLAHVLGPADGVLRGRVDVGDGGLGELADRYDREADQHAGRAVQDHQRRHGRAPPGRPGPAGHRHAPCREQHREQPGRVVHL